MANKDKLKSKHLPHGVETIIGKDGKTRYYFKGKEYDSPKDIPAPTWNWLNKVGENIANNPLVQKVAPALQKFGEFTELPGEEAWANQVGLSAQKYNVPYNVGKTIGYGVYPGFGELKGGTKALTSNKLKLQPALATVGPDSLKIPPKFQPPPGQPLAIKGLSGSSGLSPTKLKNGNIEWHVTKKQMPQIKQELENWLRTEYADKGKAALINRKEFGTIIVDGDPRQISQITQFLEEGGKLPFPPKVVTKKAHAYNRLQNTRPPKEELSTLGKQLGLSQQQINTYIKEAQDGFADVQEAARRQGLTFRQLREEYVTGKKTPRSEYKPGQYHAGHYWPANKGGATTGRTAGIESGKLNIGKKDSFEGSINLYAAQKAGIPTTWAEDMKMWIRDKNGLPGPNYGRDFNNAQRNIIESIPWHYNIDQVEAIWKQEKLHEIANIEQWKGWDKSRTPIQTTGGRVIGGDRR